jgi:hypothetical protein
MRKVRKTKTFGRKVKRNKLGVSKFEIAKLELKPGDTLVLRTDLMLSVDQCAALRQAAEQQFPGFKIAILSAGLSLAVLSEKQAA